MKYNGYWSSRAPRANMDWARSAHARRSSGTSGWAIGLLVIAVAAFVLAAAVWAFAQPIVEVVLGILGG